VIESLSKRIDYEEILTGFAKKLEIEDSLKDIFSKIQIPNNPDDAAKALKFFNDLKIQNQFEWIKKIGIEIPDELKIPISFEHKGAFEVASYEHFKGPVGTIELNIDALVSTNKNYAILHEFGYARGLLMGESVPTMNVKFTDLVEAHNDIYVENSLRSKVDDSAADFYKSQVIGGIRQHLGDFEGLLSDVRHIASNTDDIAEKYSHLNKFVEYYQKAVFYGESEISKEIEEVVTRNFGEDFLKQLDEYTAKFQKVVKKAGKDITDEDLADLDKEFMDMLDDSDVQNFLKIDYSTLQNRITKELSEKVSKESLGKLEGIVKTLSPEETDNLIKLVDDVSSGFNQDLSNTLVENIEKFGKEYIEDTSKLLSIANKETAGKIISFSWYVKIDSTDDYILNKMKDFFSSDGRFIKNVEIARKGLEKEFEKTKIVFRDLGESEDFGSFGYALNEIEINIGKSNIDRLKDYTLIHEHSHKLKNILFGENFPDKCGRLGISQDTEIKYLSEFIEMDDNFRMYKHLEEIDKTSAENFKSSIKKYRYGSNLESEISSRTSSRDEYIDKLARKLAETEKLGFIEENTFIFVQIESRIPTLKDKIIKLKDAMIKNSGALNSKEFDTALINVLNVAKEAIV
jgi:hypothetical protein